MAKRLTKSAINWVQLAERVPPEQKVNFLAFKAKSEAYLRRMIANPVEPPKINWDEYKKAVPVPGLVDKFKSEYAALKVPYPEDKLSPQVDEQWNSLQPQIKSFCEEMQQNIKVAQQEIEKINALPKFEDMTMEMFFDTYPEIALNCVNKPTFWPHTEDEQLGYVDPTQKVQH